MKLIRIYKKNLLWVLDIENKVIHESSLESILSTAVNSYNFAFVVKVVSNDFTVEEIILLHQFILIRKIIKDAMNHVSPQRATTLALSYKSDYTSDFVWERLDGEIVYFDIIANAPFTVSCYNSEIIRSSKKIKKFYKLLSSERLTINLIKVLSEGFILKHQLIIDILNSCEMYGKVGKPWKRSNFSIFVDKNLK